MHALAGDVVLAGGTGTGIERDADIEREGRADEQIDQSLGIHARRLILRGRRVCGRTDSSSRRRRKSLGQTHRLTPAGQTRSPEGSRRTEWH
ncbi:hypothetical protein D9M68_800660 [compost metagenome]